MTLIAEIGRPVQWKPFKFSSETMYRVGWLWFAIGWLRVPFKEFSINAYDWQCKS